VRGITLPAFSLAALAAFVCLASPAQAGMITERVNLTSAEGQALFGGSHHPAMTPNGRFVVFVSAATNLVPGDTNGLEDIFVRDRLMGITERVSIASGSGGAQAIGGACFSPAISADGRFVAFVSAADNLVDDDTNGQTDVFVRDRLLQRTSLVSVSTAYGQSNDGSYAPSISADGRFVAFYSYATNLVGGDSNNRADVFVRDRGSPGIIMASTFRVSVSTSLVQANESSYSPSISADGWSVAFHSDATNLVSGDTNGERDVFVWDRWGWRNPEGYHPATTRVSVSSSSAQGNDSSDQPSISRDGRYVAFASHANNLVMGDSNGQRDVFVRDRRARKTVRVNVSNTGLQAMGGMSLEPSISDDGRYVTFRSYAENLVGGDTNAHTDVFVHDRVRRTTRRASISSAGVQANGDSYNPTVVSTGGRVAFGSAAWNLVSGDSNGHTDVFLQQDASHVLRVFDRTRFSTAVEIAREGFPGWAGVKDVIIASGDDRAAADPLAASGLCWAYDAPLLLVSASRTPDEVKDAIREIVLANGPVALRVVGGPISVPDARIAELVAAGGGGSNVMSNRIISTGSRYDLAAAIARRMEHVVEDDPYKGMPRIALFANGADPAKFFDALALSPIASRIGAPILLVTATSVPPATAAVVEEIDPITSILGGGPNTVNESVRAELGATRWSGRTRYDTAKAIAEGAAMNGWLTRWYVGLAAKLPDALTGGSLMGKRNGVLLLTDGENLTPVTRTWLETYHDTIAEAYVFGGTLSISESVKTQVRNVLE
jgi:Tol biopolymer transport system component